MKKIAAVFVIAVLVPTLVLAWLAVRSLRDQELVVNSQRAMLHKGATDALAADLNTFMDDVRVFFGQLIDELLKEKGAEDLSKRFDEILPKAWGQAQFGCVVTDDGKFLSPDLSGKNPKTVQFLDDNRLFLSNRAKAVVYQAQGILNGQVVVTENLIENENASPSQKAAATSGGISVPGKRKGKFRESEASEETREERDGITSSFSLKGSKVDQSKLTVQKKVAVDEDKLRSNQFRRRQKVPAQQPATNGRAAVTTAPSVTAEAGIGVQRGLPRAPHPQENQPGPIARNVTPLAKQEAAQDLVGRRDYFSETGQEPKFVLDSANGNWSSLSTNSGNLRQLMKNQSEGAISRFLQDGLHILLWQRHPSAPGRVFWAELDLKEIRKDLKKIVKEAAPSSQVRREACLALLDSDGDVVAQTAPGFQADWKHPFVASEVGEILPHWEVAAYFLDPDLINRSAKTARLTIWLIVPILLVAISVGAFLIFRAVDYEMRFARKKTDFVSNVSHELKTPLTSIRMFSDLLAGDSNPDRGKTREYSGIVSKEAARLSRLINNLLDFSRMDRGDMPYKNERVDLVKLTRETVEAYRMQIESKACLLKFEETIREPVFLMGDRDALSRVLLNLLSNAEKYGCGGGEIEIRLRQPNPNQIQWEVLDRGPGIDRRHANRVFEKFYRVDQSLSSGIQGTGLGLSIAQQTVHHHKGSITHRNRTGGGSVFTVSFPIDIEKQ